MLVKTNEFKSINNPRKLACYAGVVPFEFKSGISIYKGQEYHLWLIKH
ncbi:MAG: transposase [Bacteroidetes bacterium]|nr:transposase [Bacteroidota bacterium]